jgi:hypothetical protein
MHELLDQLTVIDKAGEILQNCREALLYQTSYCFDVMELGMTTHI